MNILHLLPMNALSGAEKLVLSICNNSNKADLMVLCGGEELAEVFRKNNISVKVVQFRSFFRSLRTIAKVVRENKIEIIHSHENIASVHSICAKKLYKLKVKIVSHIHSSVPPMKRRVSFINFMDAWFRGEYDHNILCAKDIYSYYKSNSRELPLDKVSILSSAVDFQQISSVKAKDKTQLLKEYGGLSTRANNSTRTLCGYIGNLSKSKGLETFLYEISKYRDVFEDCCFLIAGTGEEEDHLRKIVNELKLEDMVELTGFVQDVYSLYHILDIFILPSHSEGMPVAMLEAMSLKVPVVAMDSGNIGEVLENGHNGILVEVGDYEAFISGIIALKGHSELRRKYGDNAQLTVKKQYDINHYTKSLHKIYSKVIM